MSTIPSAPAFQWKHWGAFAFLTLTAGTSFLWIKLGIRELHPATMLLWRLLLGVGVLGALALLLRVRRPRHVADWVAIVSVGLGNVALPQMMVFWSQQSVDSSVTAVLVATTPFHTMFSARLLLPDERITLRRLTGMALAFCGVLALLWRALGTADGAGWSVLLPLGAAFCYATSSVLARRFGGGLHPLMMALAATVLAALAIAPLALLTPGAMVVPRLPLTWLSLAMLGVLGGGISYVFFLFLVGSWGPTRTQMNTFVFPVVATLAGVLVLGEHLTPQLMLGGLLILAGVWLFNRQPARPATEVPAPAAAPQPGVEGGPA